MSDSQGLGERVGGVREVTADGQGVSFWGGINILELDRGGSCTI